uniref:Uncharacterized protein n=1 Tax=Strigamia maritima TaxID=126957 RepID=T1IKX1_STRMM
MPFKKHFCILSWDSAPSIPYRPIAPSRREVITGITLCANSHINHPTCNFFCVKFSSAFSTKGGASCKGSRGAIKFALLAKYSSTALSVASSKLASKKNTLKIH